MNSHNSGDGMADATRNQKPGWRWKRAFKFGMLVCLLVILVGGLFVGTLAFKYHRIVGARPGQLRTEVQSGELGRFVNPFIGTGGIPWVCGNNSPAAMVPFGNVRLGPETASILVGKRAINTSGYYYGDDHLLGFSHTRLMGTGATDGGHFLVTPARQPANWSGLKTPHTISFSHSLETASPGYYAVELPEIGVLAELTATTRVGVHRYTFKGPSEACLRIDVANALRGCRSTEGMVRVRPETQEVEGHIRTFGTFAGRYGGIKAYFVARCDQPFKKYATWTNGVLVPGLGAVEGDRIGVDLGFGAGVPQQIITLRLGISYISIENARANLDTEGTGSFDQILSNARAKWENQLSLIRVTGGSETQRRIFYTALYRVFQMPTLFSDANGQYLGFDRKVHQETGFQYFTDLSLWDTFRTVHPLYTLIASRAQRDMIISLTKMLEQGGWLPRWPAGHGYSNSMFGTPADIVIAEAYLKGIRDFDIEAAYQAMRRTALAPVPAGSSFSGRTGVDRYLEYGYCPCGLVDKSVSRTFEYGWADSAIAALAATLGHTNDALLFRDHSRFYRNLWNPGTQYFQPRDKEGRFLEPFKPLLLTYLDRNEKYTRDYVEGSALQWRWGAPFDAQGMIDCFKDQPFFVSELDQFFARASPALGAWNPGPYYWHGNEPDIHAAYLFDEANRPDLTQKWVRWILDNKYADRYDGLDGNDDAGTLSAWYIFSALGFYPVAGSDKYELGAPLFEKTEINLGDHRLTILAENYAPDRVYVERVLLDEKPLDRAWIRHSELVNAKTLRFKMTSRAGPH